MATFNSLIIEAPARDAANQFWSDRGAGENTFSTGLVPANGLATTTTATAFITSGQFEKGFPGSIFAFTTQFPSAISLTYTGTSAGNSTYVNQQLVVRNLQRQSSGGIL